MTVAGLVTAFGSGAMTNSIEEIEQTEVFLVTGSNTTENHPIVALRIKKAVREKGAKLIVMIPEKVDHSMGGVELTVGAYGKMLEDAAGIKATWIGKPNKYIFEVTLDTLAVDRKNVLMVGDRVATDIIGARAAGIKSVLVKTGEFKESDLNGDVQPDYVIDAVREIEKLF